MARSTLAPPRSTLAPPRAPDARGAGLRVVPRAVTLALAAAWGVLVAAYVVVEIGLQQLLGLPAPEEVAQLVNLDGEGNPSAWYHSTLLLACAAVLAGLGAARPGAAPDRWAWRGLAAVFLYLALDEAFSLHELAAVFLGRVAFGGTPLENVGWVFPAAGLCAVLAVALLRFLARLPGRTRWAFGLAGALYLGGAVGIEVVGGWWSFVYGYDSPGYSLLLDVEETLETAGLLAFLHALLGYAPAAWGQVLVTISDHPQPPGGASPRA